jgi:microcystin-dependent protein
MVRRLRLGGKEMRRILVLMLVLAAALWAFPATAQVGETPFIGEILLVPYNFAPKGWAFCNGQLLPISQNTALFSLLGTTYGGNGITTFALPDLQGRSPIGAGQGPFLGDYFLGQSGGVEQVTLTVSQIPAHTHQVQASGNLGNAVNPNLWAAQSSLLFYSDSAGTPMALGAVGPAGGAQPHNNLSPYLTLNYIIATTYGIYPPRP